MKTIAVHLALVAALTAGGLAAQESPCLTRTVMVNVTDADGQMVEGLGRENFRAKYRGKPVEILKFETDMSQQRIVILLDASGSVSGSQPQWSLAKRLAADVVRVSPPVGSFALLVFASEIENKVSFAEGPLAVASRMIALQGQREIAPEGHRQTALFDAIAAALAELEPPHLGDAIYLITDGGDNRSRRNSRSRAEGALLAKGVRLFVLLILEPLALRARTPEEADAPQEMTSLAAHTGGAIRTVIPGRDLLPDARQLYQQMRRFYCLQVKLPEEVDKPRDWDLKVVDENGKNKRHLEALYPRLVPCPAGHSQ